MFCRDIFFQDPIDCALRELILRYLDDEEMFFVRMALKRVAKKDKRVLIIN